MDSSSQLEAGISVETGSGWTERILYNFPCGLGSAEGQFPIGGLIFDGAGNLYGTTNLSGPNNGGTVFELSPSGEGKGLRSTEALLISEQIAIS